MLKFNPNVTPKIAVLMQYVINHPVLWDKKEVIGNIPQAWIEDEFTIEVGKAILTGEEDYLKDPVPIRRYSIDMFKKQNILRYALKKYNMLQALEHIKDDCDTLLICEVGAGLDIVLAESIKPWKKIICYDYNDAILQRSKEFFQDFKIEFLLCDSYFFKSQVLVEDCIMIADNMSTPYEEAKFLNNDKIKHIIWEGELKK